MNGTAVAVDGGWRWVVRKALAVEMKRAIQLTRSGPEIAHE